MLFSRLKNQQPRYHALAFIFSIAFLWVTASYASESAVKTITPQDVGQLLNESHPPDWTWTKEIAYFDKIPEEGDQAKILSGKKLKKLRSRIAKRIYGKIFEDSHAGYLFQPDAFIELNKQRPNWHLYQGIYNNNDTKDDDTNDLNIIDPNSTKHFALAFINDGIGYGVYALQKLEVGTLIGPYTGLIEFNSTNPSFKIFRPEYTWEDAYNNQGVDSALTGSLLTFVNDAPNDISKEKERINKINLERKEKNKNAQPILLSILENAVTANVKAERKEIMFANKNSATVYFYITTRIIYPYEQLLVDYGPDYWKNKERKYFRSAQKDNASPPRKKQKTK